MVARGYLIVNGKKAKEIRREVRKQLDSEDKHNALIEKRLFNMTKKKYKGK